MKLGIYGGTFDPPHIGHIIAAREAKKALGIDKMLLIPAAIPPHKELHDSSASAEDRMNMAALAAEYIGDTEASDIELKRGGKSYTFDTLTELETIYPNDDKYLFIGTDMLMSFEQWYRFADIMKKCTLVVFSRENGEDEMISAESDRLMNLYGGKIVTVKNNAVDISSTELRAILCKRSGNLYLADKVYGYIVSHRLYGVKPDFDWLRTKSYEMLKLERIPHVAGCEYEAVKLAVRWGADVESAREAAILHDCTKKLKLDDQLILCEKYGIILDNMEKCDAKLLHSKTGAAIARDKFGVSDEVYGAIFWHTTGRADMTLLEKIIYLADYIEPNRNFDGLDDLRYAAYSNLDAAMILGLKMSLEDLHERNIEPHPKTKETIMWLESISQKG